MSSAPVFHTTHPIGCKLVTFESHTGNVSAVAFHSEGKWLVTGSEDGTIKVWDLRWVHCLVGCAPSPDSSAGPRPCIGHTITGLQVCESFAIQIGVSDCPRHLVNDVIIHPNQGELISCDQAGSIKQWDLSDNVCSHELASAFFIITHLYSHLC